MPAELHNDKEAFRPSEASLTGARAESWAPKDFKGTSTSDVASFGTPAALAKTENVTYHIGRALTGMRENDPESAEYQRCADHIPHLAKYSENVQSSYGAYVADLKTRIDTNSQRVNLDLNNTLGDVSINFGDKTTTV